MLSSDWDDGFSAKDLVPPEAYNVSESVLTAALATVALPRFAEVLETLGGDPAGAKKARAFAEQNRAAILKHALTPGNERWLRRAWLDNETGWVGDVPVHTPGIPLLGYEGVFSAQHGWAFAGGVFDKDTAALNATLESLLKHCRTKETPFGFQYICGPLENPGQQRHHRSTLPRRRLQFSDAPGAFDTDAVSSLAGAFDTDAVLLQACGQQSTIPRCSDLVTSTVRSWRGRNSSATRSTGRPRQVLIYGSAYGLRPTVSTPMAYRQVSVLILFRVSWCLHRFTRHQTRE